MNKPIELEFAYLAGRYGLGKCPFSSPGCRGCRDMEEFLIQGWDPIVPGCRWLHESKPSSDANGGGVSTPCKAVSTHRMTVFVSVLLELYMYGKFF